MESNRNDIGRAVREKLKGFEKQPPAGGWEKLSANLNRGKQKKRIPLWFMWSTPVVIAVIVLGWLAYPYITGIGNNIDKGTIINTKDIQTNQPNTGKNRVATEKHNSSSESSTGSKDNDATTNHSDNKSGTKNNLTNNKNVYSGKRVNTKNQRNYGLFQNDKTYSSGSNFSNKQTSKKGKPENNNSNYNTNTYTDTAFQKNNGVNKDKNYNVLTAQESRINTVHSITTDSLDSSVAIIMPPCHDVTERFENQNMPDSTKQNKQPEDDFRKFYAFGYAMPSQFIFGKGAENIDRRLENNSASAKTTLGYGLYIGYNFSEKMGLRAGVMISKIDRTINGAVLDTLAQYIPNYSGVEYNSEISNSYLGYRFNGQSFSIHQKTTLLEIPVEISYKIKSGPVNINLVGGISTVRIKSSWLTAQGNGQSIAFGKLKDESMISFSTGLGATFSYPLTKSWQINAEPFVRYYLDTFSSEPLKFSNNNPFNLSFKVGIQYNFNNTKKKK